MNKSWLQHMEESHRKLMDWIMKHPFAGEKIGLSGKIKSTIFCISIRALLTENIVSITRGCLKNDAVTVRWGR